MANQNWKPQNVMSGSYGRLWLDGEPVAEAKGFEASVEIQSEAVKQAGRLVDGQKMVGYAGTGTVRLHKVYSRMINKISASVKAGVNPEFTLVSEVNDPAAVGAERVLLRGVQFSTLILGKWELGALGEEECPFTFNDWEPLSIVKAR